MNVVVINDFAHVEGGASHVALSSALGLASRGHDVTLVSAVGPIMPELLSSKVKVICTGQHDIAHDPNRLRASIQGIWNIKAARMVKQVLRNSEPSCTIVHVHGWTKALSSSVLRAAVGRDFKVVCTLNDYFSACPNGGFFNYPRNSICTLRPLSVACILSHCDKRSYPQKLWRVARQFVQKLFGLMPGSIYHFIAVSDFSRNILVPFLPGRATVHQNGNIINIPKRQPIAVEENSALVMLGRLSREKGAALLAQVGARMNCRTVFVGDGECREEVAGIYPGAHITGWRKPPEVIQYLQEARALVFPSLWYEAQPLAVLEAAALGIPSIVSDASAARELVIDKVTGLWFKSGDERDLENKVQMLQDGQLAKKLGRTAYDYYWRNPSAPDIHLDRLERIYMQTLSGGTSAGG
jgi:glycosyltransferase involved in cell wall biosynthesis